MKITFLWGIYYIKTKPFGLLIIKNIIMLFKVIFFLFFQVFSPGIICGVFWYKKKVEEYTKDIILGCLFK